MILKKFKKKRHECENLDKTNIAKHQGTIRNLVIHSLLVSLSALQIIKYPNRRKFGEDIS